ncbi:beta-N-acetylhexosaminidase [Nonlabens antarcticus]|uniref:beta-N-acetylhexosaminidase n=1 Tax=Nonlabens antarcticus TaxID=392714 RepID=UPI001890C548|nr:family 20 glycosylhydrolase [Nonlabens antarcticus]
MKVKYALIFLVVSAMAGCSKPAMIAVVQNPQILPAPVFQEISSGIFELNQNTVLNASSDFQISADFLKSFLGNSAIELHDGTSTINVIVFQKDETITNPEGYTLKITPEKISIIAATDAGAFYAVQSLRQLTSPEMERSNGSQILPIPTLIIKDEPRFSYRGMHLDVSRHMFDVDFIKKYIDAMAMLKMNNFHWHLTDDQGWRIEIKKYPKLQEIAAYRDSTLIGHYNDQPQQYDTNKYGGFYTQEEVLEVIAFAKARHVNIIPEIELPGHAQAAIAAYPQLGCTDKPVQVAGTWGVFDNIFCPSEYTFNFLENVLDEVIALFPGKYIHIGGDEAPKTQWKTSLVAQQVMKDNGLKNEEELQSYFIHRIERYINSKGKQIIGWDEILEGGLAPNATVMSWRGTDGAVAAAQSGHDVIMTPTSNAYFDYYQSENADEPTAIGGFLPLEKVYSFNPIPKELSKAEATHILGPQGNLWTEYVTSEKQVEYQVFPRMIAMSEVAWSPQETRNYEDFIGRLEGFHNRLDMLDINYANHLFEVKGAFTDAENYSLTTLTKDKQIRFTIDGTALSASSELYSAPILFDKNLKIKAAVFKDNKQLGNVFAQELTLHKAVGATISINKEPHPSYTGSGAQGLINGIKGSDTRFGDSEWLGFWGEDIEVNIEFEEPKDLKSLELRFFEANGQWVYVSKHVDIYIELQYSATIIDRIPITIDPKNSAQKIFISLEKYIEEYLKFHLDNKKEIPPTLVNSLKLTIPNYGIIPDGLQGAGNKAWTFIDEITIQ